MARINVNISGVMGAKSYINAAKREIASSRKAIHITANLTSSQIRNRKNIDNRINSLIKDLNHIETKIGQINSVVLNGIVNYQAVEHRAINNAKELSYRTNESERQSSLEEKRKRFMTL